MDPSGAEHDAAIAIAALRDGHAIGAHHARALGHALTQRLINDAELGAFAMLLALQPPPVETLADIARGVVADSTGPVPGRVAWIADNAPTGSARHAIQRSARSAAIDVVTVESIPVFERIAHSAGAASPTLTALRVVHETLAAGAAALLCDFHLDAALELGAAQAAAESIVALAQHCGIAAHVRVFRLRAPLGCAFGPLLEATEAREISSGGGPVPLRVFVTNTLEHLARLGKSEIAVVRPVAGVAPTDHAFAARKFLRAPMDGTVLRLDPAAIVTLARVAGGIRLLRTVGDEVQRGGVVLEVVGNDPATVDRVAAAVAGAWTVGSGHRVAPSAQPVAQFGAHATASETVPVLD